MRSSTCTRSSSRWMWLAYCAARSAVLSAVVLTFISAIFCWCLVQIATMGMDRAMIGINRASTPSIFVSSPSRRLAQPLDFRGQARIAADVECLDIGQAAIDVAEPAADFARGALRALARTLPVFLFLGIDVEMRRLLVEQQAGKKIAGNDHAAGHRDQEQRAEANPQDIDAGVVGNARTDAHQFGIGLVAVKRGAGAVHLAVPFFSAKIGRASCRERVCQYV